MYNARKEQAAKKKSKESLDAQLQQYRNERAQLAQSGQVLPARPEQVLPARPALPARPEQVLPARPARPEQAQMARPARPEQVLPARPARPTEPTLSDIDKRLMQIDLDEKLARELTNKLARELADMELAHKIAAEEASGSTSFPYE